MDERYLKQQAKMARPIPGMSLTNDPDSPASFEGPPEFTKRQPALEAIFEGLIEPDVYSEVVESLATGIPVVNVTEVLLYEGFRQGKWNPDLFVLLIEPTMYMIMALAERAGVEYTIDNDADDPEQAELSEVKNRFEVISKKVGKGKVVGALPDTIEKQIKELPVESLLSRPVDEEDVAVEDSLITRPE